VLQVPIGFFFEGLESAPIDGFAEGDQTPLIDDFINSPEGVALAAAFARIRDPAVRRKLLELARTLAGEAGGG
jgi:hypothetical protein